MTSWARVETVLWCVVASRDELLVRVVRVAHTTSQDRVASHLQGGRQVWTTSSPAVSSSTASTVLAWLSSSLVSWLTAHRSVLDVLNPRPHHMRLTSRYEHSVVDVSHPHLPGSRAQGDVALTESLRETLGSESSRSQTVGSVGSLRPGGSRVHSASRSCSGSELLGSGVQ